TSWLTNLLRAFLTIAWVSLPAGLSGSRHIRTESISHVSRKSWLIGCSVDLLPLGWESGCHFPSNFLASSLPIRLFVLPLAQTQWTVGLDRRAPVRESHPRSNWPL